MHPVRIAVAALIAALATLLGAAAVALPFAETIAGWFLGRQLAMATGEPADISVAALAFDGAVIDSIRAGDSLQLSGVQVRWQWQRLLDRRLDEVTVERARLQPRGGAGATGAGWMVDRIRIGEAIVDAPLPWGSPIALSLNFDATIGRGRLSVEDMGSATMHEADGVLWVRAESPWKIDLGEGRSASVTGPAGDDWRLAIRPLATGGYAAAAELFIEAALPEAEGMTVIADGQIAFGAQPRFDFNTLSVAVRGLRAGVAQVDATLNLSEARGSTTNGESRAALEIKARNLDAGDFHVRDVDLRVDGRLTSDGKSVQFALAEAGRLVTGTADLGDLVTASPAALAILSGTQLEVALADDGVLLRPNVAVAGELALRVNGVQVLATIPRCDIGGDIAWPEGPLLPAVSLSNATIDIPQWSWRADAVAAMLAPLPTGPAIKISASPIGPVGSGVLSATAELSPVTDGMQMSAHLHGPGVDVTVAGSHDWLGNKGSAKLDSPPIRFAPGQLQPQQIFPGLDVFSEVSGTATIAGGLSWSGSRVTPDLRLALQDASGRLGSIAAEGVDAALHLDGLAPLSTPPNQRVSVRRIDSTLPLTDGRLSFRLDGGRIVVARAAAQLAGGNVSVTNAVVDPGAARKQITLGVTEIDLAQIIELIQVDGLSGRGRLSGTIPLVLTQGHLSIADARLDSNAPGVLRYRPSDPSRLTGMAESMELLLKALDDFHYTKLSMTLHGEAGGDLLAGMTINGANPGLYDGYPIELNLNVSGQLGSIMDKARFTDEIPDILRRPAR